MKIKSTKQLMPALEKVAERQEEYVQVDAPDESAVAEVDEWVTTHRDEISKVRPREKLLVQFEDTDEAREQVNAFPGFRTIGVSEELGYKVASSSLQTGEIDLHTFAKHISGGTGVGALGGALLGLLRGGGSYTATLSYVCGGIIVGMAGGASSGVVTSRMQRDRLCATLSPNDARIGFVQPGK